MPGDIIQSRTQQQWSTVYVQHPADKDLAVDTYSRCKVWKEYSEQKPESLFLFLLSIYINVEHRRIDRLLINLPVQRLNFTVVLWCCIIVSLAPTAEQLAC